MSDADDKTRIEEPEAKSGKKASVLLKVAGIIVAVVILAYPYCADRITRNRKEKKLREERTELCETLLEQYYGIPKETANVQVQGLFSSYFSFSFCEQDRTYRGEMNNGIMSTELFRANLEQEVADRTREALADIRKRFENERYKVSEPEFDIDKLLPAWITKEEIEKYMCGESEHQAEWKNVKISCYFSVISGNGVILDKEDFRALRENVMFLNELDIQCFRNEAGTNSRRSSNAYKGFTYYPENDTLKTVIRPGK